MLYLGTADTHRRSYLLQCLSVLKVKCAVWRGSMVGREVTMSSAMNWGCHVLSWGLGFQGWLLQETSSLETERQTGLFPISPWCRHDQKPGSTLEETQAEACFPAALSVLCLGQCKLSKVVISASQSEALWSWPLSIRKWTEASGPAT